MPELKTFAKLRIEKLQRDLLGAYFVAQGQMEPLNFAVDGEGILKFAVDFIKAFTSELAPQSP